MNVSVSSLLFSCLVVIYGLMLRAPALGCVVCKVFHKSWGLLSASAAEALSSCWHSKRELTLSMAVVLQAVGNLSDMMHNCSTPVAGAEMGPSAFAG